MTQPIIEAAVAKGALIHIDEHDIYARLSAWGYRHKTVCHARGEYACDEDGDGFCEIHVNTIEATWSLLRSPRDSKLTVPSDVISPCWLSRSAPARDLPT